MDPGKWTVLRCRFLYLLYTSNHTSMLMMKKSAPFPACRWNIHLIPWMVLLLLPFSMLGSNATLTGLTCEYRCNPLGIGVTRPRLSWQITAVKPNFKQSGYEIRVAESAAALNKSTGISWSTGKILSDQSVLITYLGAPLRSAKRYFWKVRIWDNQQKVSEWSDTAWWETGLLDSTQWKANWIAAAGQEKEDHRPVYFRKEFFSAKRIKSARLYISSLGLYQVFVNGEKVGKDLFTPGWTSYNKRIQYQTYDVTEMLATSNAIGAVVGDGWYRGNIGGKVQRNYYGEKLALIAQLEIAYSDGTNQTIVTDDTWRCGRGAILLSDIYNGETIDANQGVKGWDRPGTNPGSFDQAIVLNHPKGILMAQQGASVREISTLVPQKIMVTPKGETVYDMGQNMVGWVRLKVKGRKGDRVVLRFAEVLDKAGNFYTENLRKAKATDELILGGEEETLFEPHFTFHGFRYVKLEQFPGKTEPYSITGVVIHSDMPLTGSFSCSDSLVNQLQHNIQWGQRGNFLDVPTDCPQRDERLGWTGDAQVFAPTAAFNFGVAPFFTKWLADLAADQLPNGKVPDVVPDVRSGRGSSTAWGDASIAVPWALYQAYGDTSILAAQYPSMKAWVEWMRSRSGTDHLWRGDPHYGDWLAYATTQSDYPGATTEKDLIANGYFAFSTERLSLIAGILHKEEERRIYAELAQIVRNAFCHEYLAPSGRLVSNTQTAYALALVYRLLPDSMEAKAAAHLAEDVKRMKHLTTGFVGTPLLCQALSDHGYGELAFELLMNKEYPSWLYPITRGATTIWERWDGIKPDGSFQDLSMNSFNHYAYGAIGNWLYCYVAGIGMDAASPGYHHFLIQPHVGGGLTHAAATLKSMYGTISSEWKKENGRVVLNCEVPANTTARVVLEGAATGKIWLNGQPIQGEGLAGQLRREGRAEIEIGSGSYSFSYPEEER